MNKAEAVVTVAARAGVSQRVASDCIDALLDIMCEQLAAGGEMNLTGYMKVSTVARAARLGRNPQTGEAVPIAASTGVKIQPGTRLKAAARG